MFKFDGKTVAIVVLVLIFVFVIFSQGALSRFVTSAPPTDVSGTMSDKQEMSPVPPATTQAAPTPAALMPNEIPVSDTFGQFSPQDIIGNQNYLDPRNQIGYPETVGGVLRNANLQYRSEPMNPRDPVSIFNISTIVPDTMRPSFEIQDKEYS